MSLKIKAAALLTAFASYFNTSEAKAAEPESNNTPNTEQFTPRTPEAAVAGNQIAPSDPQSVPEPAIVLPVDSLTKPDTISEDLTNYSVMTTDSTILAQRRACLEESKELMLYLIAHFEGMRCRAYYDRAGKKWTICLGSTRKPDGTPVRSGDVIRSEKEALNYTYVHIDDCMSEDMITYLPLEKMSTKEQAVCGSLLYNCGSGILRKKDKSPSNFSITACEYFLTHNDSITKEFNAQYLNFCHAGGHVNSTLLERRKTELYLLSDEVNLTISEPTDCETYTINLREASLGIFYGCKGNPTTIISRFKPDSPYRCETDSLQHAINKELQKTQKPKTTRKRSQKTPPRSRNGSRGR